MALSLKQTRRRKLTAAEHTALAVELYGIRERLGELLVELSPRLGKSSQASKSLWLAYQRIDRLRFTLAGLSADGLSIYQGDEPRRA